MTNPIVIEGLHKAFGRTRALDGLDLVVAPGQIHGFLGPNGAGKSTALRVLLGLIRADAGTVRLLGGDPWADAVRLHRRIAYVPGDVSLWPNLTGGEVIDLLGRLRGGADRARRDELVARFGLDPTRRCGTYSTGNRRKVALVAAFASGAELLLLDEPTAGLDPLMEEEFRRCVREERGRGAAVLLSSHILSEVEALCDHVTIIRAGRTVESGSLAGLRHLTSSVVTAELSGDPGVLADLPGVRELVTDGRRVSFRAENGGLGEIMRHLAEAGPVSLTVSGPTLEELFLRYYRDDGAPASAPAGAGPAGAAGAGADR